MEIRNEVADLRGLGRRDNPLCSQPQRQGVLCNDERAGCKYLVFVAKEQE